jgi:hypothetical protein
MAPRQVLTRTGHRRGNFAVSHNAAFSRIRRVAGSASATGSAGHAGAKADVKLTFHLDHSAD